MSATIFHLHKPFADRNLIKKNFEKNISLFRNYIIYKHFEIIRNPNETIKIEKKTDALVVLFGLSVRF